MGDLYCKECHYDEKKGKFKCDQCIDDYYFNIETEKCELITYDEHPEITPGCMIPINNLTYYQKNKKCFKCKQGFFKTKEESCVYCRARINGGPSCEECEYSEKNNNKIQCKYCLTNLFINGKCHNCEDEVGPGC